MGEWQSRIVEPAGEITIEWLAGHFVGEGSISASVSDEKLKCGVPKTRISVMVGTVVEEEVRTYLDYFGVGGVYCSDRLKGNRKPVHFWKANSKKALLPLEELKPHLHVGPKRKQAEYAIEYLRGYNGNDGQEVSLQEANRRLRLCECIKKLTQ